MKKFEDYLITEDGRVFYEGKELRQSLNKKRGYKFISHNGKMYSVHRLVAKAYVKNPEKKPQTNHKDGNKLNNHYTNLEWCTHAENQQHAYDTGLKTGKSVEGEKNGRAKMNKWKVQRLRLLKEITGDTYKNLAKLFKISDVQARDIIQHKSWKHV